MTRLIAAMRRSGFGVGGFAGIVAVGVLTACASGGAGQPTAQDESTFLTPVRVEVSNNALSNVVVYAVYSGQRHRMGELTALSEGVLAMPRGIPEGVRVRFQVDPIGPRTRFLSRDYFVDGGDVVTIRVQPNIRQSTVTIR